MFSFDPSADGDLPSPNNEVAENFRSRRRKSLFNPSRAALLCFTRVFLLICFTTVVAAVDYGALIVSRCQTAKGNGRCVASGDSCRIVGGILGTNPLVNETVDSRNQIPFRGRASPLPVWTCLPHEVCCIIPPLAQSNACSICGVAPTITTSHARSLELPRNAAALDSPNSVDDENSPSARAALTPMRLRSAAVIDEEEQQQVGNAANALSPRLGLNMGNGQPKNWWCWHAALVDRHTGNVFGSAVLIAQAWLLTVAHKLRNRTPADFFVVLGERNFGRHNDDSRVALVRDIIVHPEFNLTTFVNDIALLRIADAPCNGKQICTVCLGTGFGDNEQLGTANGDDQQQQYDENSQQVSSRTNVVPIGDEIDPGSSVTNSDAYRTENRPGSFPSEELQARRSPLPPLDSMYGLDREFRSLSPPRPTAYYGSSGNDYFNADARPAPFGQNNAPSYWQQQRPFDQLNARTLFPGSGGNFAPQYVRFQQQAVAPQQLRVLQASARQLLPLNSSEQLGSAIPPIDLSYNGNRQQDFIRRQVLLNLNRQASEQPQQQEQQLQVIIDRKNQRQQSVDPDAYRNVRNNNQNKYAYDVFRELPKVFNQDQVENIKPGVVEIHSAPVYGKTVVGDLKPVSKEDFDQITNPETNYAQAAYNNVRRQQRRPDSPRTSSIKVYNRQRQQEYYHNADASTTSAPTTATDVSITISQQTAQDAAAGDSNYRTRFQTQLAAAAALAGGAQHRRQQQQQQQQPLRSVVKDWLLSEDQAATLPPVQQIYGRNNIRRPQFSERRPHENFVPSKYSRCVVTGWGSTRNTTHAPRVQQANMELRNNQQCLDDMRREEVSASTVPATMMCARGANHTPLSMCEGDGGGPLVCQLKGTNVWYLEGLAALGASVDCESKTTAPSMYVKVSNYRSWIEKSLIAFIEQQTSGPR